MGMTNAERQAAYRKRKALLGQKPRVMVATEREAFVLERVLLSMRETGAEPCVSRNPKTGRFMHLDV